MCYLSSFPELNVLHQFNHVKKKKSSCGSSNVHNLRRNVKNFEGSSNVMVVAAVDAMVCGCNEGSREFRVLIFAGGFLQ